VVINYNQQENQHGNQIPVGTKNSNTLKNQTMSDISKEQEEAYQDFFNFMSKKHDLKLNQEQMDDIVWESQILNSELDISDGKFNIPDNREFRFIKYPMNIEKEMHHRSKQILKSLHLDLEFEKHSGTLIFVEQNSSEAKIKDGYIKGISECIQCIEYRLYEGEMHPNINKYI
jgi:hypothetical protein